LAIFPVLSNESTVQVGDKTRLDATRSYAAGETITKVEINPDGGATWFDVTGSSADDWYLDWTYSSAAAVVPAVRVTTSGSPTSVSSAVTVITSATDNLFSADSDLTAWEPDIFKYLPSGRATFLNVHREAQKQILDWLDRHEIWDGNDDRLTAAAVVDVQEVKEWSKFLTLQIIFESLYNAKDDVFSQKSVKYAALSEEARARAQIKLDLNGSGTATNSERVLFNTIRVVRS